MTTPKLLAMVICVFMILSAASVRAVKARPQKFNDAIKRSGTAAELIDKLAQLSQNGIPKELLDKAEAIGVFPCKKTDLLIEHAVSCRGVISRYLRDGWSMPAFYRLVGGGLGRPDSALRDSAAMILLFMNLESIAWLKDATSLEDEKTAVAGPIGTVTAEQREKLLNAPLIAYSYRKDGLLGRDLKGGGLLKGIFLGQDKNIHENLYGIKGHEVLSGMGIFSDSIPSNITLFPQALQKHYGR